MKKIGISCPKGATLYNVGEQEIPEQLMEKNDGSQRLVWYWFQRPDGLLNDVFDLKLYLTKNAILRRPQEVVFARVSTLMLSDRNAASERLDNYANDLHREIAGLYSSREKQDD